LRTHAAKINRPADHKLEAAPRSRSSWPVWLGGNKLRSWRLVEGAFRGDARPGLLDRPWRLWQRRSRRGRSDHSSDV